MDFELVRNVFIVECQEHLQKMEDALLKIGQVAYDDQLVYIIFLAAHTIKGSSNMFALEPITSISHHAENVIAQVRSRRISIDHELKALLLSTCNHLGSLVTHIALGSKPNEEEISVGDTLCAQLRTVLNEHE